MNFYEWLKQEITKKLVVRLVLRQDSSWTVLLLTARPGDPMHPAEQDAIYVYYDANSHFRIRQRVCDTGPQTATTKTMVDHFANKVPALMIPELLLQLDVVCVAQGETTTTMLPVGNPRVTVCLAHALGLIAGRDVIALGGQPGDEELRHLLHNRLAGLVNAVAPASRVNK